MAVGKMQWDDPIILEYNRQRLRQELARRWRHFEAVYGVKSADIEGELQAGRLHETAEVCEWLIAYHTYLAIG